VKGRYIGENIRTISDLMEYTTLKNEPGILLLIDFEKAFDSIRWSFLFKCLKYFNIGDGFITWIKTIYNNTESTVTNNGHMSDKFKISRGIRQGCPVSPYLFIMAVEVMAISIRSRKNIKGIKVNNTEFKLTQLADDTTLSLQDIESVINSLICLKEFSQISGLNLNIDKTIGKCIGSLAGMIPNIDFKIQWTKEPIHTLGVTISDDPNVIHECNFLPKLQKIKTILNIWKQRRLSLKHVKGKVVILKSLIIPKLLYVVSNMPITEQAISDVEKIIADFLLVMCTGI
jgi:hypothetical protein